MSDLMCRIEFVARNWWNSSKGLGARKLLGRTLPWHLCLVATTFWVGEIHDPNAEDGSQMISAYDGWWYDRYGGCDGDTTDGTCQTEERIPSNDFFPRNMQPKENPFYLDLPFNDVSNATAFSLRHLIPWAEDPGYAGNLQNTNFSYLKNRWVELQFQDKTCFAQIADAGPAVYDDFEYVFGENDVRPKSQEYDNAGLDVSPAVVGCLGFIELNGTQTGVSWRFVEAIDVPPGPWKKVVTTSGYDWTSGGPGNQDESK